MGFHFAAMSGIQQFVIDQTVTVDFTGDGARADGSASCSRDSAPRLAAHGGTAGILRDQAPAPLDDWPGVDCGRRLGRE